MPKKYMSKSDELREQIFQRGPWYVGVLYSPRQKIMKTFATNSISRYLDEVNNSAERLDKQDKPYDFGVVYLEEFQNGQEKVKLRQKELATMSDEELRKLVMKNNPELKMSFD